MAVYLDVFLSAAISAAAPATSADLVRYDSARVSMTVASQARLLPPSHGMSVTPSGRLPSDLASPAGSFVAGKPALVRPRQMMSFSEACLAVRPGPSLHDMPCEPSSWTIAPQGHS